MSASSRDRDWTDAELSACVDAYLAMLDVQRSGRSVNKSAIRRALLAGPLSARTDGSIEFRMQNISAAMEELGLGTVSGYLPAKNVGAKRLARIKQFISEAVGIERGRLPVEKLRAVTPEHVWNAVQLLLSGYSQHPFDDSVDYDLLVEDGNRLPPKAVFGVALSEALGIKALPEHFSGGIGTPCFRILEEAGYTIVPKTAKAMPAAEQVISHERNREWSEGSEKVRIHLARERSAGLREAKKAHYRREHGGKLACERCGMDPVATYGEAGEACIEVHHSRVQVQHMVDGHQTRLEDLQCLCANCHRVVHRLMRI
ncbi:MAG: HNH endonuclease [Burkholderiales bacterium]